MIINSNIVGIIADDLTGANDTALQFYLKGANTQILLSDEIGVKKAAEQLGVVYSTLVDWRKIRSTMRKKKQNVSSEPLTEREKQLMKEIAELKDAMSFFVKDRRK